MWRADSGEGFDPTPIPRDASGAPRRTFWNTWLPLSILGAMAVYCGAAAVVMPRKMNASTWYEQCNHQLGDLASAFVAQRMQDPKKAQRFSGASLWIAMRRDGVRVRSGADLVLVCQADDDAESADEDTDWNLVDLEHPPRELCSYAGRDFTAFPLDEHATEPQPIGACVHHRDGVLVAFDNGWVQMMYREQVGLGPDDPVVVGPESKSPLLRMLLGGN